MTAADAWLAYLTTELGALALAALVLAVAWAWCCARARRGAEQTTDTLKEIRQQKREWIKDDMQRWDDQWDALTPWRAEFVSADEVPSDAPSIL